MTAASPVPGEPQSLDEALDMAADIYLAGLDEADRLAAETAAAHSNTA